MKKLLSVLTLAALVCSFTPAKFQPDFTGTWKLNEGKSDLGQFGARGVATKIIAEQKADAVTLTKTSASFDGSEATNSETLLFSGKESESTVFGSSKKKSTLKWSADGNSMVITYTIAFERNGQSFDLKGTESWTMGADGKTLTLSANITTPQGEITTKAVYEK